MDTIIALSKVPAQPDVLDIVYSKSVAGTAFAHEEILEDALYHKAIIGVGTYILWVWTDAICGSCHHPVGFETGLVGVYTVFENDQGALLYTWGVPDGSVPAPTKVVTWPPK